MINQLRLGWDTLRKHSQLMLVASLLIVFPVIFVFTTQQFLEASTNNVNTATTQRMSSLQDSIEYVVRSNGNVGEYVTSFAEEQSDLQKLRLVKEDDGQLVILFDLDPEKIGNTESDMSRYRSSLAISGESYIFPDKIDNQRTPQVFRAIEFSDAPTQYIFTEHNFSKLDTLLDSRVNEAYFTLIFMFLFLIALAYWVAIQINYRAKYDSSLLKLEERDLFTNSLAHELRAPLTAMRGFASLIEESGKVSEPEKGYAIKIKDSTARLVVLVNDFLEAARIQSGSLGIKKTRFDAGDVVRKVVSQLQATADLKSLEVTTSISETTHNIYTDTNRLEQILTNILSNSIKYTSSGNISVSLSSKGKYSIFVIADSGNGISAEDQRKLFSPFVRVGAADQNKSITGSGLGMWITKQLVEQLGGSITLESIKGVGTHIIIKLKTGAKS